MSVVKKILFMFVLAALFGSSSYGQGIFLTGVGAVNRSMGGASTAAPLESMGALHWNPATISGLTSNEVSFSTEVMLLDQELTAGGITTNDESGVAPIPAIGWVHHLAGTNDTVGLGIYSFGGFGQNMPATVGHPILDPTSFGPLYSEAQFFQIVPTFSRAITDRLSVGFAPTINLGKVVLDPIPFGPGVTGPGAGTRWSWGIGAQAGVFYRASETTRYGFSIKSPQWFEEFRTHTVDIGGTPVVSKLKLDLPMVLSAGMSYTGLPCWTLAMDVRYFDYKNTDGFGKPDIYGTELGWDNVFAVALGAQRKVNESLYVRAGYTFNTSAIDASTIGINFATPLIQQHVVGLGASYKFAENVDFTMSYNQILESDRSGVGPFGPVSNQVATYSIAAAVTVRYGN